MSIPVYIENFALDVSTEAWTYTGCTVPVGFDLLVHARGEWDTDNTSVDGLCYPEGQYYAPENGVPHYYGYKPSAVNPDHAPSHLAEYPSLDHDPAALLLLFVADDASTPDLLGQDTSKIKQPNRGPTLYRASDIRAMVSGPARVFACVNTWLFSDNVGQLLIDLAATPSHEHFLLQWNRATDDEDRRRGGFCAETGIWAPDHCLVETSQGRMIDYFAPDEF